MIRESHLVRRVHLVQVLLRIPYAINPLLRLRRHPPLPPRESSRQPLFHALQHFTRSLSLQKFSPFFAASPHPAIHTNATAPPFHFAAENDPSPQTHPTSAPPSPDPPATSALQY